MNACEHPSGCARYNDALYSTNPSGSAPRAYRHMNAHSGASPRRGPGLAAWMGAGSLRISGLRETMAHTRQPRQADHPREPEGPAPSPPQKDGGHHQRCDHRAQRPAAIGHRQAAPALVRRQRLHHRAQASWKGGAFAEPQRRARRAQRPEPRGEGVRHGCARPAGHRRAHSAAQPRAVQNPAPQRVGQHVGNRKRRNDEAVLRAVEARFPAGSRAPAAPGYCGRYS